MINSEKNNHFSEKSEVQKIKKWSLSLEIRRFLNIALLSFFAILQILSHRTTSTIPKILPTVVTTVEKTFSRPSFRYLQPLNVNILHVFICPVPSSCLKVLKVLKLLKVERIAKMCQFQKMFQILVTPQLQMMMILPQIPQIPQLRPPTVEISPFPSSFRVNVEENLNYVRASPILVPEMLRGEYNLNLANEEVIDHRFVNAEYQYIMPNFTDESLYPEFVEGVENSASSTNYHLDGVENEWDGTARPSMMECELWVAENPDQFHVNLIAILRSRFAVLHSLKHTTDVKIEDIGEDISSFSFIFPFHNDPNDIALRADLIVFRDILKNEFSSFLTKRDSSQNYLKLKDKVQIVLCQPAGSLERLDFIRDMEVLIDKLKSEEAELEGFEQDVINMKLNELEISHFDFFKIMKPTYRACHDLLRNNNKLVNLIRQGLSYFANDLTLLNVVEHVILNTNFSQFMIHFNSWNVTHGTVTTFEKEGEILAKNEFALDKQIAASRDRKEISLLKRERAIVKSKQEVHSKTVEGVKTKLLTKNADVRVCWKNAGDIKWGNRANLTYVKK